MRDSWRNLSGAQRLLLMLLAAIVLARLAMMLLLPLMDTTEARYGEMARKMAELGDWITLWHEDAVPYWGKPPLAFWLSALSLDAFGVSEFSLRLPHFLASALSALVCFRLALRRSAAEALLTSAILFGSLLFIACAGAMMTDAVLALGLTLAMYGGWSALVMRERGKGFWVYCGIVIGLLAKGPVMLVLTALPLLGFIAWRRDWRTLWTGLPWVPGLLTVMICVLPWYVAAELRTPGFLDYFLVGEHWHRFVTPGWKGDLYGRAHHYAPATIWLFALVGLLPWSVLAPVAYWTGRRRPHSHPEDAAWGAYLLCWAVAPLLFFSAASNIIWPYALPAAAPMALLWASWWQRRIARPEYWICAGLAITLLVVNVISAATTRPALMDRLTARSLVQAFEHAHPRGRTLYYVNARPFSAMFYSRNGVVLLPDLSSLRQRLRSGTAFAALRQEQLHGLVRAGVRLVEIVGTHGVHTLVVVEAQP